MVRGVRASAWAGVTSVVLLVPAAFVVVLAGDLPAPDATAARIVDYLNENRGLYLASLLFEIVSMALLLWFLTGLAAHLSAGDEARHWAGVLLIITGGLFAVLMLIEDAAFAASARLADLSGQQAVVRGLWEFGYQAAWPFTRGFVVLWLGVAAWMVRDGRRLPTRVALFSVVAAVVNATFLPTIFVRHGSYVAGGFLSHVIGSLALELWVLDTAVLLLRASRRAS